MAMMLLPFLLLLLLRLQLPGFHLSDTFHTESSLSWAHHEIHLTLMYMNMCLVCQGALRFKWPSSLGASILGEENGRSRSRSVALCSGNTA